MNSSARSVILVVDDEPETLKYVGMNLEARGYEIWTAADGVRALDMFDDQRVNLVLLDITMPGFDGFQVCQRIREHSNVPIVVLSARGREHDKVKALDMGADDYLTKPFGVRELLARVQSALRRAQKDARPVGQRYDFGDLEIDLISHRVVRRGTRVRLSPAEFTLLSMLVRNAGKILTSNIILENISSEAGLDDPERLRLYIDRLRRKLEDDPERPSLILTEPEVGYRFADDFLHKA